MIPLPSDQRAVTFIAVFGDRHFDLSLATTLLGQDNTAGPGPADGAGPGPTELTEIHQWPYTSACLTCDGLGYVTTPDPIIGGYVDSDCPDCKWRNPR